MVKQDLKDIGGSFRIFSGSFRNQDLSGSSKVIEDLESSIMILMGLVGS